MLAVALLLSTVSVVDSCSHPQITAAEAGQDLTFGTAYSADLDGDGMPERILITDGPRALSIHDGDAEYHSRDRWQVVVAALGDTDRDGLLEVVTLLDDEQGRHLGLFAYFGGEYRERFVTSALSPRPLGLQVCRVGEPGVGGGDMPAEAQGDLVLLVLEPAGDQTDTQGILCRWNGFGFTSVGTTGLE